MYFNLSISLNGEVVAYTLNGHDVPRKIMNTENLHPIMGKNVTLKYNRKEIMIKKDQIEISLQNMILTSVIRKIIWDMTVMLSVRSTILTVDIRTKWLPNIPEEKERNRFRRFSAEIISYELRMFKFATIKRQFVKPKQRGLSCLNASSHKYDTGIGNSDSE